MGIGIGLLLPGKMGLNSLGVRKKYPKWEWDKCFVTMTSCHHLFTGVEKRQRMFQAPWSCQS